MQQQLQHLYTLPPNPQTQQQISELHERVTVLQRQGWSGSIGMPPQQQQQFGMGGPSPYMPQVSLLLSFVRIDTKTFFTRCSLKVRAILWDLVGRWALPEAPWVAA